MLYRKIQQIFICWYIPLNALCCLCMQRTSNVFKLISIGVDELMSILSSEAFIVTSPSFVNSKNVNVKSFYFEQYIFFSFSYLSSTGKRSYNPFDYSDVAVLKLSLIEMWCLFFRNCELGKVVSSMQCSAVEFCSRSMR